MFRHKEAPFWQESQQVKSCLSSLQSLVEKVIRLTASEKNKEDDKWIHIIRSITTNADIKEIKNYDVEKRQMVIENVEHAIISSLGYTGDFASREGIVSIFEQLIIAFSELKEKKYIQLVLEAYRLIGRLPQAYIEWYHQSEVESLSDPEIIAILWDGFKESPAIKSKIREIEERKQKSISTSNRNMFVYTKRGSYPWGPQGKNGEFNLQFVGK